MYNKAKGINKRLIEKQKNLRNVKYVTVKREVKCKLIENKQRYK